jgi:hypothetical protein
MPTRIIPLAFACCVLIAGCTAMHPRVERVGKKLDCDGSKECLVTVTVNCLHYLGCDVSVDYDLVFVAGKNKQMDIRWKLVGEKGVEFAANGIAFDSSVFQSTPESEGKDQFVCKDTHPDFGIFKYSVNVTVKDSLFGPRGVQSLDPWVVNY